MQPFQNASAFARVQTGTNLAPYAIDVAGAWMHGVKTHQRLPRDNQFRCVATLLYSILHLQTNIL